MHKGDFHTRPERGDFSTPSSVLGAEERIQADQRARWQRGERVLIENYLPQLPADGLSPEALLDLIYGEIMLREEMGDRPQLAEYQQRFPQHAEALARQFAVHEALEGDVLVSLSGIRAKRPVEPTFPAIPPPLRRPDPRRGASATCRVHARDEPPTRKRRLLVVALLGAAVSGAAIACAALGWYGRYSDEAPRVAGPAAVDPIALERERRTAEEWQRRADQAQAAERLAVTQLQTVQDQAATAQSQLRQERYFGQLAQAEIALRNDAPAHADFLLQECPDTLRGWEWHYLKRLCRVAGKQPCALTWRPDDDLPANVLGRGHTGRIAAIAFCPLGTMLASASGDRLVRLWDWATGKELLPPLPHKHAVAAAAFSPDSRWLVTGGGSDEECELLLWDMTAYADPRTRRSAARALPGHKGKLTAVAFRPSGGQFATSGSDGAVKLWDLQAAAATHTLKAGAAQVLAYRPDGRQLASAGSDRMVRVWAAETGELLQALDLAADASALAYSPSGAHLVVGTRTGKVQISWDAANQPSRTFTAYPGAVTGVAFTRDGSRLAVAGTDGTVRLEETAGGREVLGLFGHRGPVTAIAFNPTGTCLASGGQDHRIRWWRAPR